MIKKIALKNFESHEDSEIEFSKGLNLIIGQSNQGKSSIVRAIALVAANRFDKDCVRTGTDFCTVKIDTEKGSVQVERGEGTNHWIIETSKEKKEYRNIGVSVPPEVGEILGMGERIRGEIKELPNIMFQLEKHYMLSEIDGKKATSNVIARMMDEAIGIGGMEELVKDIATDFASKKKDLGTKNIQISELRGKILDVSIFESYQKATDSARDTMKEVESLDELLDSAKALAERLSRNKKDTGQVFSRITVSDGLEPLADTLSQDSGKFTLLSKARQKRLQITEIASRLQKSEGVESLSENMASSLKEYDLLKRAQTAHRDLEAMERTVSGEIDFQSDIGVVQRLNDDIENAEGMISNARSLYKKIRGISNHFIQIEGELKTNEDKFVKMKNTLGVCPLCGGNL